MELIGQQKLLVIGAVRQAVAKGQKDVAEIPAAPSDVNGDVGIGETPFPHPSGIRIIVAGRDIEKTQDQKQKKSPGSQKNPESGKQYSGRNSIHCKEKSQSRVSETS
jgi:hypothetical protein